MNQLDEKYLYDEDIFRMLSGYSIEKNPQVKISTAMTYYNHIEVNQNNDEQIERKLSTEIEKRGLDYRETRTAAFLGYVLLGKHEELTKIMSAKNFTLGAIEYYTYNSDLIKVITENWELLNEYLGDDFYSKLTHGMPEYQFLSIMSPFIKPNSVLSYKALDFIYNNVPSQDFQYYNFILLLERLKPKSEILREYCLKMIKCNLRFDYYGQIEDYSIASQVLGRNFAGDENVLSKLIELNSYSSLAWTMCEGWIDSEHAKRIFNELKERNYEKIKLQELPIMYLKADEEIVLNKFYGVINRNWMGRDNFSKYYLNHFETRLEVSERIVEALLDRLMKNPTPNEFINIFKLLKRVGYNDILFDEWTKQQLELQKSALKNYVVGFDLLSGEFISFIDLYHRIESSSS